MSTSLEILSGLVLEDGRPWGECAEPSQVEDAKAVLSGEGARRHMWLRARGRSKTLDAAAVALSAMLAGDLAPGAEMYAAASDRDQAALVRRKISGLVTRSGLAGQVVIESHRVSVPATELQLAILSADAASAWGLSPSLLLIDEFAMWSPSSNTQQFLDALLSSLPKVPGARALLFSTPSHPLHPAFRLYESAMTDPAWRVSHLVGPAPWQDPAEIEAERRRLPESMFRRLFGGEWTAADDVVTSLEDVRECVRKLPATREPVEGMRYAVGVDLSVTSDYTAVAVCHAEQAENARRLVVDDLRVWKPSRSAPLDMTAVETHIEDVARRYGAVVVADKYQAVGMTQRLRASGVPARGEDMTAASNTRRALLIHQLLRDRLIEIPPDDELVAELASLTLRETTPGTYRLETVGKGNGHRDRTTAISLAAEVALQRRAGRRMRFRTLV